MKGVHGQYCTGFGKGGLKKREQNFFYYRTSPKLEYINMCFESLKVPSLIVNGIVSLWDSYWVDPPCMTLDYTVSPELPLGTFVSTM